MPSAAPLTKNCPHCRAVLAAETHYCGCGHSFETAATASQSSSDLVVQAEVLYETHLRARLRYSVRTLQLAKAERARDLRDAEKATRLRETEKEVKLFEMQLAVQSARVADARARSESRSTPAALANTEPPQAFRVIQTIKAEEKFELLRYQRVLNGTHATPAPSVFNAVQNDKARNIADPAMTTQSCPGCASAIAVGMTRCQCGFVLTGPGAEPVSDFISADELAALRK